MKAATVQEIKQELITQPPARITEICMRLARFKKENKELLTYLLFEAHNEDGFVQSVISEIDTLFSEINLSQLYYAKKSLRKIVRIINKFSRYSGQKETELRLRLHFLKTLKASGIPIERNPVINNLSLSQLKKLHTLLNELHEDLQYDYRREVEEMGN